MDLLAKWLYERIRARVVPWDRLSGTTKSYYEELAADVRKAVIRYESPEEQKEEKMPDSVITREQKRAANQLINHNWGFHFPQRVLRKLSLDQIQRIIAILREREEKQS